MTFDLSSGLHMQIQTWHLPLWLCKHAKYYVKSGLTNVLKNANKTKNMHLFSIRIANYTAHLQTHLNTVFSPRTIPLWNSLPASIAEAPSLESFKKGFTSLSL